MLAKGNICPLCQICVAGSHVSELEQIVIAIQMFPSPLNSSPDLNPIENLFALAKRKIARDAAQLRYETMEDFERRVTATLEQVAAAHGGCSAHH